MTILVQPKTKAMFGASKLNY